MTRLLYPLALVMILSSCVAPTKLAEIAYCPSPSYHHDDHTIYTEVGTECEVHISQYPSSANLLEFWVDIFIISEEHMPLDRLDFRLVTSAGSVRYALTPDEVNERYKVREQSYRDAISGKAIFALVDVISSAATDTETSVDLYLDEIDDTNIRLQQHIDQSEFMQTIRFDYLSIPSGCQSSGLISFAWLPPKQVAALEIDTGHEILRFELELIKK